MNIHSFTFSPFKENTYVLSDESKACVIVDPGCYDTHERKQLKDFIEQEGLQPTLLLLTHCHIDHVFGAAFVAETWKLTPQCHPADLPTLKMARTSASLYGVNYDECPTPEATLADGDSISFGNTKLDIVFVPGHAPGHVAFIHHESRSVINGDVLFHGSIGRVDLPGGDFETLEKSIREKLYVLPDDYTVYCGHGPETTIGQEKKHNAFVKEV